MAVPLSHATCAGKTFAFSGTLAKCARDAAVTAIQRAGGSVSDSVTKSLDYLVVGATRSGTSAAEKKAAALRLKGAVIEILDEAAFYDLLKPPAEAALALLLGGPAGVAQWNEWYGEAGVPFTVDLAGRDFQKAQLAGAILEKVQLDGCDFRGATLTQAVLGSLARANFEQADLTGVRIQTAAHCNFQNAVMRDGYVWEAPGSNFDGADLTGGGVRVLKAGSARRAKLQQARLNPADLQNADLAGADLSGVAASHTNARDARFDDCDLTSASFEHSRMGCASFRRVNFTKTRFHDCYAVHADFEEARFPEAELSRTNFSKSNFKNANLAGAIANDANFTECVLDGADFTGANVLGARFDPGAEDRAIGLQFQTVSTAGPLVAELARIAAQASRLEARARIDLPDGAHVILQLSTWSYGARMTCSAYETHYDAQGNSRGVPAHGNMVATCLQGMANRWGHGALQVDQCEVKATKAPLKNKELLAVARAAWCEVFSVTPPTEAELASQTKEKKAGEAALREAALVELRGGPEGVRAWNARSDAERRRVVHFRKTSFAGLALDGGQFKHLDLQAADFTGASLASANFYECHLRGANLSTCRAEKALFAAAKLTDAVCIDAHLVGCNLRTGQLLRTDFTRADLTGAELNFANLRGANFSGAKLTDVVWHGAGFDETTVFPAGFDLPEGLAWSGKGADPRLVAEVAALAASGPIDLETFLKNVAAATDAARFTNALKMLKADSFQLFAETTPDSVTGIVKSQSDASLVYACRLDSTGGFTCCTQNLNVCGGLRGALCKHLLVLLIGLTKAETLDPTTVHTWMSASRLQKPLLDKDRMSAVFLRYKGAEAGELDWRPTETVPEDFYAF